MLCLCLCFSVVHVTLLGEQKGVCQVSSLTPYTSSSHSLLALLTKMIEIQSSNNTQNIQPKNILKTSKLFFYQKHPQQFDSDLVGLAGCMITPNENAVSNAYL